MTPDQAKQYPTHAIKQRIQLLEETLRDLAAQHHCGCGHPHCKRCADDEYVKQVLEDGQ